MASNPIADRKAAARTRDYARERFNHFAQQTVEATKTRQMKAAEIEKAKAGIMERRATAPRRAPAPAPAAPSGGLTAEFASQPQRGMGAGAAEAMGMDRTMPVERRVAPAAGRRAISAAEALGMDKTVQLAEQNAAKLVARKLAMRAAGALTGPIGTAALTGYEVGQYGRENFDTGTRTLDALGISPQYDPNSVPETNRFPSGYREGGAVKRKGKR